MSEQVECYNDDGDEENHYPAFVLYRLMAFPNRYLMRWDEGGDSFQAERLVSGRYRKIPTKRNQ